MKTYFILLFLSLIAQQLPSQPITFSKVFSNYPLNSENGFSGISVPQGYMVVSTLDCETFSGNTCCGITFLNQEGDIQWFKEYNFYPGGNNSMVFINNNIYIASHSNNNPAQFVLYCIDMNGDILWNKEYGHAFKRESYPDLLLSNNYNLWICGSQTKNGSDGVPNVYAVKTDLNGNVIDTYTYGIENDGSYFGSIYQTLDGQILINYTYCPETCFHLWKGGVVSINDEGDELWYLDLFTSWFPDRPFTVQFNDSTLVTYWHSEDMQSGNDPTPSAFYFLNMHGEIQDSLVFYTSSFNIISDLEGLLNNGLIACGRTANNTTGNFAWIVRVGPDQTVLWNRMYTDTTYFGDPYRFADIHPTADNGFIAVGTLSNEMTGVLESHTWFVKLDSSGCYQPGCGEIVYVSAHEEPKFLKGIGMEIFPNPASDQINLRLPGDYKLSQSLRAVLLDAMGRRIIDVPFSNHELSVNISALPEGIYYMTVRDGNEIMTSRKVLKVR